MTAPAVAADRATSGVVGPNAVIQLAAALKACVPDGMAERIFARAEALEMLHVPPDAMIDEAIPARLFRVLWSELPSQQAAAIAYDAGRRTGAYVAGKRIPAIARAVLRALPARWAEPLLLKAIGRNAWTFAGSGRCLIQCAKPATITIVRNPLASPGCAWHVGVLESLFGRLVSTQARVHHAPCCVEGAPADRFEINLCG